MDIKTTHEMKSGMDRKASLDLIQGRILDGDYQMYLCMCGHVGKGTAEIQLAEGGSPEMLVEVLE